MHRQARRKMQGNGRKERRRKKHKSDPRRRHLGGHNHYQFGMPRARQRLGSTQRIEQARDHFNTFPQRRYLWRGSRCWKTTKSSKEPSPLRSKKLEGQQTALPTFIASLGSPWLLDPRSQEKAKDATSASCCRSSLEMDWAVLG